MNEKIVSSGTNVRHKLSLKMITVWFTVYKNSNGDQDCQLKPKLPMCAVSAGLTIINGRGNVTIVTHGIV